MADRDVGLLHISKDSAEKATRTATGFDQRTRRMAPYRILTLFAPYGDLPPQEFHLSADQRPAVNDKVLSFCDTAGVYYEYNWDLISYTTLSTADSGTIQGDKP